MILTRGLQLRQHLGKTQLVRTPAAESCNVQPSAYLNIIRNSTHFRSGAVKPMPNLMPFGLVATALTIIPGLFVGAMISKHVANFLEENDLFVPADDDDDDD